MIPVSLPSPLTAFRGPGSGARTGHRRSGGLAQRLLGTQLADALAGPHDVDHYLEILRPDWAVRRIRGRIVAVRHQNDDSVTVTLRPTGTWPGFRAGQHVEITVEVDGVRHRRCYSPAGSAHHATREIELTIRTHDEGVVSQHLKRHARVGMHVGLSTPRGDDFVLPDDRPRRIVLISGGSGITPVLSMLRTLVDEGYDGQVAFLHYARSHDAVLYGDELEAIAAAHPNVTVLRGYTRDDGGELSGRFGAEHLARVLPEDADAAAFACGPGGLVEAVRALWDEQDLRTPLRYEHFAPPELPAIDPDLLGSVTFAASDRTVDATDGPLLEQAEAAGLSPTHGCRMGICLTCKCRLEQGQVRDTLTGEIYGAPGEEVRICVAAPVGDVTVDL